MQPITSAEGLVEYILLILWFYRGNVEIIVLQDNISITDKVALKVFV